MNDKDIIHIQKHLFKLIQSLQLIETLRDDISHFRAHEKEKMQLYNRGSLTLSPLECAEGCLHTAYGELDISIKVLGKMIDDMEESE